MCSLVAKIKFSPVLLRTTSIQVSDICIALSRVIHNLLACVFQRELSGVLSGRWRNSSYRNLIQIQKKLHDLTSQQAFCRPPLQSTRSYVGIEIQQETVQVAAGGWGTYRKESQSKLLQAHYENAIKHFGKVVSEQVN